MDMHKGGAGFKNSISVELGPFFLFNARLTGRFILMPTAKSAEGECLAMSLSLLSYKA